MANKLSRRARMLERQKQALQPVPELSEKQQEIADRKAQFLDLFPRYGTIGDTLRRIGLKSRSSFYEWLKADAQFAAEFTVNCWRRKSSWGGRG